MTDPLLLLWSKMTDPLPLLKHHVINIIGRPLIYNARDIVLMTGQA